MEKSNLLATFELKAADEALGEFEGHASIFGNKDQHDDIVMPGAFEKTLVDLPKQRVKMLRQHDPSNLIGVWQEIREDSKGLFVKGKLLLDIQAARETFSLLRAGVLDSMSIGFRTVREEIDSDSGVRKLLELRLFEISMVTFAANLEALVTSVKHASPEEITSKRELERALKGAGFPNSTSAYITAGWTPPARRDAEGTEELVSSMRRLTESLRTATGA